MDNKKLAIKVVMSKQEILQELKRYYSAELAEDKQDGTSFDCVVLAAIDSVAAQRVHADLALTCQACAEKPATVHHCNDCYFGN